MDKIWIDFWNRYWKFEFIGWKQQFLIDVMDIILKVELVEEIRIEKKHVLILQWLYFSLIYRKIELKPGPQHACVKIFFFCTPLH